MSYYPEPTIPILPERTTSRLPQIQRSPPQNYAQPQHFYSQPQNMNAFQPSPRRSPSPSMATSRSIRNDARSVQKSQPIRFEGATLASSAWDGHAQSSRRPGDRSARSASPMRYDQPPAHIRTRTPPMQDVIIKGSRGYLAPLEAIGSVRSVSPSQKHRGLAPLEAIGSVRNRSASAATAPLDAIGSIRTKSPAVAPPSRSPASSPSSRSPSNRDLPPLTIPPSRYAEVTRGRGPSTTGLRSGMAAGPDFHQLSTNKTQAPEAVAPRPIAAPRAAPPAKKARMHVPSMHEYLSLEQLEDLWQNNDFYAGTIEAPPKPKFTTAQILEARAHMGDLPTHPALRRGQYVSW